jgi:hypothetical protein
MIAALTSVGLHQGYDDGSFSASQAALSRRS